MKENCLIIDGGNHNCLRLVFAEIPKVYWIELFLMELAALCSSTSVDDFIYRGGGWWKMIFFRFLVFFDELIKNWSFIKNGDSLGEGQQIKKSWCMLWLATKLWASCAFHCIHICSVCMPIPSACLLYVHALSLSMHMPPSCACPFIRMSSVCMPSPCACPPHVHVPSIRMSIPRPSRSTKLIENLLRSWPSYIISSSKSSLR